MLKLLKEYLSILILKHRHETVRQCVYDSVAYAEELAAVAKKNGEDVDSAKKMAWALAYLQKCLPGISDEDGRMYISSLVAKIVGVGATGAQKF